MPVLLDNKKFAYFPVPKCACTSLKHFFFEVENGFAYQQYVANGRLRHIHNVYESVKMAPWLRERAADKFRVAVVREPVARLLSCYSNRVLHHGELDHVELTDEDRERGLTLRPDLGTFIRFLGRYKALHPSIEHHSRPLAFFLGKQPEFFDRIYDIKEVSQLVEDFRDRYGEAPEMHRLQTGGPKLTADDLNAAQIEKIKEIYSQDYNLFGEFFGQGKNTGQPAAQPG